VSADRSRVNIFDLNSFVFALIAISWSAIELLSLSTVAEACGEIAATSVTTGSKNFLFFIYISFEISPLVLY
jgi:hypothetical protein